MGRRETARVDLDAAVGRMEAIHARLVPADFLKQQFNVALEDLYTRAVALHFAAGRPSEALETAERARARAFVDLLASRNLALTDGAATDSGPRETTSLTFRGSVPGGAKPSAAVSLVSESAVPAATTAELAATARRLVRRCSPTGSRAIESSSGWSRRTAPCVGHTCPFGHRNCSP